MFGKVILITLLMSMAPKPVSTDQLVSGNAQFAIDIYQELASEPGNLFFSPYSVSSALSMTCAGARENTEKQMLQVLHQQSQSGLHPAFLSLNNQLSANEKYELNIANGLCLTGGDVRKNFKKLLKDNYNAEIFSGDLKKINSWANKKTKGKIPKILDQLDSNSACILLNAIYFKADWESEFDSRSSFYIDFFTSINSSIKTKIMHQTSRYKYFENSKIKVLEIPYKSGASMIVFLPHKIDGLSEFELNLESLPEIIEKLDSQQPQRVKLAFPKMKMKTDYDLANVCMELGMKDAFNSNADFSGMSKNPLSIAKIKHKAFLVVDEKGTAAAAVTAVEMKCTSMPPQNKVEFRADHPFMFLIRDNETGSLLFIGRMTNPASQ
jgi:serpin B